MLPVLHEALGSEDRVVRSNAARGCGAIGDPASIPLLIKALDLESGLSRASIVWALGELKAKEALPALAGLYGDARHDEQHRRGSGFRGGQAMAVMQAQYESLRSFDSISGDWDDLKAVLKPRTIDPRRDEELLEPRHILDAVAKLGPGAAQDFYRRLAAEKEVDARHEASIHLAEGTDPENLAVLRNLSADPEYRVRIGAAVSLCMLNDVSGPPAILELLRSPHAWIPLQTVQQLARVKPLERLAFAAGPLRAMAADPTVDASIRETARRILAGLPTR